MAYSAKILCDSISPNNVRLTTMEVTFPRIILSEFNTHRVFSRNSASSRAIPVEKMLERVKTDPFVPEYWGKNQKGMSAEQQVSIEIAIEAKQKWLWARANAVSSASRLSHIGIHKQITNRLLEPFMWQTVIVSATEWDNFFALRCHPDAQPEIHVIASMMKVAYEMSQPLGIALDEWHLPLVSHDEMQENDGCGDIPLFWQKVSAGRCARVSYLTHDGKRDLQADVTLCEKLQMSGHMSPLEHVAQPMAICETKKFGGRGDPSTTFAGNFRGWIQFRKTFVNEAVFRNKS